MLSNYPSVSNATPNRDVMDFLGFPGATKLDRVWLHVDGKPKGTYARSVGVSSLYLDRAARTIGIALANDPARSPENRFIAAGRDYEIVYFYREPRCTLLCAVDDPRDVELVHPVGVRFKFDEATLFGESDPADNIGYWRGKHFAPDRPSLWLKKTDAITGDDQYRVIVNDFGNNRIECSPNLRGKTFRFTRCVVFFERHAVGSLPAGPLPRTSIYVVSRSGDRLKLVSVSGYPRRAPATSPLRGLCLHLRDIKIERSEYV